MPGPLPLACGGRPLPLVAGEVQKVEVARLPSLRSAATAAPGPGPKVLSMGALRADRS